MKMCGNSPEAGSVKVGGRDVRINITFLRGIGRLGSCNWVQSYDPASFKPAISYHFLPFPTVSYHFVHADFTIDYVCVEIDANKKCIETETVF